MAFDQKSFSVQFNSDGSEATVELSDKNIACIQEIIAAAGRDDEEVMQTLVDITSEKYRAIERVYHREEKSMPLSYHDAFIDTLEQYEKNPEDFLTFLNKMLAIYVDGTPSEEVHKDDEDVWKMDIPFTGNGHGDTHVALYNEDKQRFIDMLTHIKQYLNITETDALAQFIKILNNKYNNTDEDAQPALLREIQQFEEDPDTCTRDIARIYYQDNARSQGSGETH